MTTKGCIVIHGLLGTPAVMAGVTRTLLDNNYRVIAPCLAGHGADLATLSKTKWEEWYATVHLAYRQLRRDVDKVYYVGTSLGALLGLKLAIEEGWGIKALALIGTPMKLTWGETMLAGIVRNSPLKYLIKSLASDRSKSIADPDGQVEYAKFSLDRLPANSVFELQDLQEAISEKIATISNPMILLHGKRDPIVPLKNIDFIKDNVSSDVVDDWVAPESKHVITMDYDKVELNRQIIGFFNRF